ncbi:MAG: ROK family protein [Thermodesulfobacteriota bacterium]
MSSKSWAIGVDLGGTKVEVASVDSWGNIRQRLRRPTEVQGGPVAVKQEIIDMVREVSKDSPAPAGVGVGVAGQVRAETGMVHFAPNLDWHEVPLQDDLKQTLGLPVVVINDVRAATWGEWLHGAGKGCSDLVCLFIGTGIGGGVVSGGRMLSGCSNTAGELGHMTIDLHGPSCHCGNRGCLEALAGGWAIARRAREAIAADPAAGEKMLAAAGIKVIAATEAVTAAAVTLAAREGDRLAQALVDEVAQALIAGAVSLANTFNPCRLILGGGVMAGMPELIPRIDQGVRRSALQAATSRLEVLPAKLGNEAGVVGAASLAMKNFTSKEFT